MTVIESVTIETPDPAEAEAFYKAAFGQDLPVHTRASEAPTAGFRGFTLSLVVPQPSTVDTFIGAALQAGATELKPPKKSLWGYGGVVCGPDGTIWTVATLVEEEPRPRNGSDRRVRPPAGSRRRCRHQAVLRRARPRSGEELRQQVCAVRQRRQSPWRSTAAATWPRPPVWPRTARDRTASPSPARQGLSPIPTDSRGKPREHRAAQAALGRQPADTQGRGQRPGAGLHRRHARLETRRRAAPR